MDKPGPFVIGIHDLSRRPGATRTLEREVPAPADLGIEVIGVPLGAPVAITARLDSVVEGVVVTATVSAPVVGECVRCLTEVTDTVEVDLTELYAYAGAIQIDPDDDEADEIAEIIADSVDLEQPVRDAVVLALPFQPLCRPDCAGLCAECGIDLNEAGPDHTHTVIDARWAALVEALGDDSHSGDAPSPEGDSAN